MFNLAMLDEVEDLRDGNELDRQLLGLIGNGLGNPRRIVNDDRRDPLCQKPRIGRQRAEQGRGVARVAGLLEKLSSAAPSGSSPSSIRPPGVSRLSRCNPARNCRTITT